MSHYNHLSIDERESVLILYNKGTPIRRIASSLGRSPSTISRELSRYGQPNRYRPHKAQQAYEERRERCRRRKLLEQGELLEKVKELFLERQWSPEQISNRLKYENNEMIISYTTIYRGINAGMFESEGKSYDERGVILKLRHKGKKRRKRGETEKRGKITFDYSISDRPKAANERKQAGHWEADTLSGDLNTGMVLTLVDRKTRYLIAAKLRSASSYEAADAMIHVIRWLPKKYVKSITPDQGTEFRTHRKVTQETGVPFYFAHRHAPWERGTSENTNGLLREYMPKRTSFKDYSEQDVQRFVEKLNRRPRKCLGWKTPYEVFFHKVLHLT